MPIAVDDKFNLSVTAVVHIAVKHAEQPRLPPFGVYVKAAYPSCLMIEA